MNARRWISRLDRARVLVVGDLMLDRYVWGTVRRISPEAPVPVVQVSEDGERAGGAGNVVANLAALGARPAIAGIVGRDAPGRLLAGLLGRLGADLSGVVTSGELGTIEKTRVMAHGQQLLRLDRDPARPDDALGRRLVASVERKLAHCDVVLVSDYGKGAVGSELLERLAAGRARHGYQLLIDPKQPNFDHYRGATLVKPNEAEAEAASGLAIRDRRSLRAAGSRLLERWQSEAVLISRGEHGMALCRDRRAPRLFATAAREVFDVTGAGDTVLAVAALVLGAGGSLEEAAELANLGAGIVVGKVGTATVSRRELAAAARAVEV